ncbi:MAG: methylenetetrahydrofolate reductase [NAD(P)H] [Deltaproteobacteria bacterium]|nr:methylenetetrahydrofolate reductase [NAD(P)H] [Deltaproteobacteria bacterium]MDD9854317.1 methylenetetrahydrofolate reductase [NAD(P)H] [Deltaproteobacteria bacterium]MDD9873277.1 methylenetetrahydrofolate reductase [NAD(P)H] [Deltaproteobacteria bacterium]
MRIPNLYAGGRPVFSFEFFPPKSQAGHQALLRTIAELARLEPGFVSVTSHPRGETRNRTADLVIQIQAELGITAMAHVTCMHQAPEALRETLQRLEAQGIGNVLALRGDPPPEPAPAPARGGFRHASELAAFIRSEGLHLAIGGACYPEKHPEAPSFEADLDNLKRKLDAGAEFLITQLFLDNSHYLRFRERAAAAGITAPIVPGIMPMVSHRNLQTVMRLSPGSETPAALRRALGEAKNDGEALEIGVEWATQQCAGLLEAGAPGVHFYTLNRSPASRRVRENLAI